VVLVAADMVEGTVTAVWATAAATGAEAFTTVALPTATGTTRVTGIVGTRAFTAIMEDMDMEAMVDMVAMATAMAGTIAYMAMDTVAMVAFTVVADSGGSESEYVRQAPRG